MSKRTERLEETAKLKRARQLSLRLEDMLKEQLYRTGSRLQELQQERKKIEERIIVLENKPSRKSKPSKNVKQT